MSTTTKARRTIGSRFELEPWQGGVGGGPLGALVFGLFLSATTPETITDVIPALYGIETPAGVVGWALHMSHGAILGLVFAVVADADGIDRRLATNLDSGLAGLAYGLVLWLALGAVLMPIWLQSAGVASAPTVPNLGTVSLAGHAVYGVVLGISYAVLSD